MTNLGTVAQARSILAEQLAQAEPIALSWGEPLGGATELSIRLVSWDDAARGDDLADGWPSDTCLMLPGTFHVFTSDGLLDANVAGGITNSGFQAMVYDEASVAPLNQRYGTRFRHLEINLTPSGGTMFLQNGGPLSDTGPSLVAAGLAGTQISLVTLAPPVLEEAP